MGVATTSYMTARRPKDTAAFLEYCHSLGAGGIQSALSSLDPAFLAKLRDRAGQLGMFLEVMGPLPKSDTAQFESVVKASKEVGAICVRAACLGGRRYETFQSLTEWNRFVAESHAAIERALPILEKHKVKLALENHKDWTVAEFAALLRKYSSPWLGVCLDTGNNMALLDDSLELTEALAPYAISTHIKDMAVLPYEDGFLLSEVPFGDGMLDLKRIVGIVRAARPDTKMTLEMITRDPLRIPCLTEKYWATFPGREAVHLARMLRTVNEKRSVMPLPRMEGKSSAEQLAFEEENVRRCLTFARDRLGLV